MALTATMTPNTIEVYGDRLTCLLVARQVNCAVAARAQLFLEKVVILDVSDARLDEPGLVELPYKLLRCLRLNHALLFDHHTLKSILIISLVP